MPANCGVNVVSVMFPFLLLLSLGEGLGERDLLSHAAMLSVAHRKLGP